MITKNEAGQGFLINQTLKQIDSWVKQEEFQEEILLQSVNHLGENLKQNQVNIKEVTEKITQKIQEWEKLSREQYLTKMTPLNQLNPIQSFEQINEQLDRIQRIRGQIVMTPLQHLLKEDYVNSYVAAVERYIESRRNRRERYVKNVKQASSMFFGGQDAVMGMFNSQMKNMMNPFHKYMQQPN